jgi:hypothetical protein
LTDLVSNIQIVLQDARYETRDASAGDVQAVAFEDDAVMGFVCVFGTAQALIAQWKTAEVALLAKHAAHFRNAGDKAWNVYCAFVTAARSSEDERRVIRWIEEDLERTRKITATGLQTREDVTTALLPLLPIVSKPVLAHEDPTERLRRRIAAVAPGVEALVLNTNIAAEDVVRRLGERS